MLLLFFSYLFQTFSQKNRVHFLLCGKEKLHYFLYRFNVIQQS